MDLILISDAEKSYIWDGIEADLRCDGRTRISYRPMEIETNFINNANGSARIRLANTDVLTAVKAEIDVPNVETPNVGIINFFTDCSANATPSFEGRGGEDLAHEINGALSQAYECVPLHSLCIIPGKSCWKLSVDVLILECGGNLYDAISLAVKAALTNTDIPKVDGSLQDGENVELQLSDDPFDCWKLDVTNAPCLVTLCKIGDYLVVDPSAEEESCSSGSVVVAVTQNGSIVASSKLGEGSFHPKTISTAIDMAASIGKELNIALSSALQRERMIGLDKCVYGFIR